MKKKLKVTENCGIRAKNQNCTLPPLGAFPRPGPHFPPPPPPTPRPPEPCPPPPCPPSSGLKKALMGLCPFGGSLKIKTIFFFLQNYQNLK